MQRLWEDAAFDTKLSTQSYWASTVETPAAAPPLEGDQRCEVAIIGAGFTGLNAAIHLARAGVDVLLVEAQSPFWGASGRNGGFCCLGGSKANDAQLRRLGGTNGPADWAKAESAAVGYVDQMLQDLNASVDRHSNGETSLAHTRLAFKRLQTEAKTVEALYGVKPQILAQDELQSAGLGGNFYGALTIPKGFALNPRKYALALYQEALKAGGRITVQSPVEKIQNLDGANGFMLQTPLANIHARKVLVATNGYTAEDIPPYLRARALPVQSSIIITRALTPEERQAQGWFSDQMAFDTRHLLHYFRALPDGRFLFGMRGGLSARPSEQRAVLARIHRNFAALFPAWRDVDITHEWSGLICLTRNLIPFIGAIPKIPGLFAAYGYHGNGVAMGSYAGALSAQMIGGMDLGLYHPAMCQIPPRKFALGRARRAGMRAVYTGLNFMDLF